jgi:hypothetical protein
VSWSAFRRYRADRLRAIVEGARSAGGAVDRPPRSANLAGANDAGDPAVGDVVRPEDHLAALAKSCSTTPLRLSTQALNAVARSRFDAGR